MLWRAGQDIIHHNVETHIYVLSDFDPAGDTIFTTLAYGTKEVPVGISRFCDGVPVLVHKLALSEEQVRKWKLPTRPAKKKDGRAKRFIERHGDISAELDAIPAPMLRQLVDDAIASHMPLSTLQQLKTIEAGERQLASSLLDLQGGAA